MMAPASGSSRPASIFSSVVLPAPFGPHRPTRSPCEICQVTSSSRTRSPKDFVREESWINQIRLYAGSPIALAAAASTCGTRNGFVR